MDVPVDHDRRAPLIQQGTETVKTAVAQVLLVPKPADRGASAA